MHVVILAITGVFEFFSNILGGAHNIILFSFKYLFVSFTFLQNIMLNTCSSLYDTDTFVAASFIVFFLFLFLFYLIILFIHVEMYLSANNN